jgi:hypothetical protein
MVVALAGIEKAGRSFPRLMPPKWQLLRAAIDEQARFKVVPDAEVGFLVAPHPGTDSRGFLNAEPWPGRATFLFLGNSFLTGANVGLEGSFTNLTGRMLDQPVLNLGIPAAGVERHLLLYRRFGMPLRPRVVAVCLYLTTDFSNDERFRNWVRAGRETPFVDFRNPGQGGAYQHPLALLRSLQLAPLLEHSWLFNKGREIAITWIWGRDHLEDRYRFPDGVELLLSRGAIEFARAPADADDSRIDTLAASLDRLRTQVTEQGSTLLVVLLPSLEELVRASPSAERVSAVARTRQRLIMERYEVLDLYPALRTATRLQAPYARDGHLNAYGNRIVADEFVAWFHRRLPALTTRPH